jgi:hypothetical protein
MGPLYGRAGRLTGGPLRRFLARAVAYLRGILAGSLSATVLHGPRAAQNGMFAPACLEHCMAWNSGPTVDVALDVKVILTAPCIFH